MNVSEIISLAVAAVFGLWGYHKRLYPAWAFIFNVLIATYLALMLTPVFLKLIPAGEITGLPGQFKNAAVMLLIFSLYLALSQLLSKFYLTNTYCVSIPKWIDETGGGILGFLGGYIMINLVLFALVSSPIGKLGFIPKSDGRVLLKVGGFVSAVSLQKANFIQDAIAVIADYAVGQKQPAKTAEKPSPAKITKPQISDSNTINNADTQKQKEVNEPAAVQESSDDSAPALSDNNTQRLDTNEPDEQVKAISPTIESQTLTNRRFNRTHLKNPLKKQF